jgi:hypothetical protein
MENLKDKKISFTLILVSILMLIFGIITKDYNHYDYQYSNYKEPPLEWFDVNIFGISFDYINFILFFIIILGIGIYLLIYKNDQSLKKSIKNPRRLIQEKFKTSGNVKINNPEFLEKLKNKYTEFESSNLPKKEIEKAEQPTEDRATSIVGMVTIVAIIFTFFMATKVGFSLWFFIIYAYYHYLTLAPKSKKEITIKSISYPLIFLILFSLFEKGGGETIMGMEIDRPLTYYLSKHFIGFVICVLIMFFSLRKQLGNKPKFSIKNPLFWISLICFLISIFRFGVIIYLENN